MAAIFNSGGMLSLLLLLSYLLSLALTQQMQSSEQHYNKISQYPERQFRSIQPIVFFSAYTPFFLIYALQADSPVRLLCSMLFLLFLVYISLLDFRQEIIPDRLLGKFLFLILLAFPLSTHTLADASLGGLAGFSLMLCLSLLTKGAIGGGDIKLLFALGFWLGTSQLLLLLTGGFLLGGVTALFLLITKKKKQTDCFAYGPYFCLMAALLSL